MRMRARCDLAPRRAAGLWPVHERREALAQHAPPVGGNLRVVARVKAADACDALLGAVAAEVPTLKASGGAMVPVVPTGTREKARARTVAPLPLP